MHECWIPASAGMTAEFATTFRVNASVISIPVSNPANLSISPLTIHIRVRKAAAKCGIQAKATQKEYSVNQENS